MSKEPDLFEELRRLSHEDGRYALQAYVFLYQSLERTQKLVGTRRHVSGKELLDGFRVLAVESFGPLTLMVLRAWGLSRTEDVGEMVFNLVRRGLMGKTEDDRIEDFQGVYDFEEAFEPGALLAEVDARSLRPSYKIEPRELPTGERPQRTGQGLAEAGGLDS